LYDKQKQPAAAAASASDADVAGVIQRPSDVRDEDQGASMYCTVRHTCVLPVCFVWFLDGAIKYHK